MFPALTSSRPSAQDSLFIPSPFSLSFQSRVNQPHHTFPSIVGLRSRPVHLVSLLEGRMKGMKEYFPFKQLFLSFPFTQVVFRDISLSLHILNSFSFHLPKLKDHIECMSCRKRSIKPTKFAYLILICTYVTTRRFAAD